MIRHVLNVSDEMRVDCYSVANTSVGDADLIYYTIRDLVNRDGYTMFVSENNNSVRGFVLGHMLNDTMGRVDRIYVDKRHQRQGIGTALLRAYEDYAQAHGAVCVSLNARATVQAKNFYAKNGYIQVAMDRYMEKKL
ncbi:MAG: GNAT family N-acetyltransferase [Alphaproteobacteria bacterium]|nr:GNAT family N-acetyltransferase [Alphaproteobacteria bacterium]